MIPSTDSLLKYETPVRVSKTTGRKSPKGRPLKVSPQQPPSSPPVPPPPKSKSASGLDTKLDHEEMLNTILPPREWMEGNQLWVQPVSSTPATRIDVINLVEQLDLRLQERQARESGICPIRRELYNQCFDELIRQVTINCAERGQLLMQVKHEIEMTLAAYQTLYESSVAFGMRKALQAEKTKAIMEIKVPALETEVLKLKRELDQQMEKCEMIEKIENQKRVVMETKHRDAITFMQKGKEQLKVQLEGIITPKK